MSAAALPIYNLLIAKGVSESEAREAAEAAAAAAAAETLQAAKTHAEEVAAKTVARAEEKAAAQFVSKDEYHARDKILATRADLAEVNRNLGERMDRLEKRMDDGFAELRSGVQVANRISIGILTVLLVLTVNLIVSG